MKNHRSSAPYDSPCPGTLPLPKLTSDELFLLITAENEWAEVDLRVYPILMRE